MPKAKAKTKVTRKATPAKAARPKKLKNNQNISGSVSRASISRTYGASNLGNGMRDPSLIYGFPTEDQLTPDVYYALYKRFGVAKRVAEAFAKAVWRKPPYIRDNHEGDICRAPAGALQISAIIMKVNQANSLDSLKRSSKDTSFSMSFSKPISSHSLEDSA